jgi:hypothetical protein
MHPLNYITSFTLHYSLMRVRCRLYMWEYSTDPTINLRGLVNKILHKEDMIVDSGRLTPDKGSPPTGKHKHM